MNHPNKAAIPLRDGLCFANVEQIIDDVQKLRRGYEQGGNWSLEQVCYHLNATTSARMAPGPYPATTPEQKANRQLFEQVLQTGRVPAGLVAPQPTAPPEQCGPEVIDQLLTTLQKLDQHRGSFAPHRIFGEMSDDESRQQIRIHCAHHLRYLAPRGG